MPLVSIITPMHNGARHIAETIRSVQAQTFGDYEHLIIDNNSTDNGCEIVQGFADADERIKLLSNPDQPGAGPTRNVGIRAAEGRYIAFLDCDDLWRPNKLKTQIEDMQANNFCMSWSSYGILSGEGEEIVQHAKRFVVRHDLLSKRITVGCLTVVYDTEHLGKMFMGDLPMRQDFCLWLDIMQEADRQGLIYAGNEEILADYRTGGMTSNKLKAAMMQWRAYREHLGLRPKEAAKVFAGYAFRGVKARMTANRQ